MSAKVGAPPRAVVRPETRLHNRPQFPHLDKEVSLCPRSLHGMVRGRQGDYWEVPCPQGPHRRED